MNSWRSAVCNKILYRLHQTRTFIDAKVKWVRDHHLDNVVQREKNLQQVLSLINQIRSSPSKSLPLSSLSLLKPHFNLPTSTSRFLQTYPFIFSQFQPSPSLPLHVKLTPMAVSIHNEEQAIHNSPLHRNDAVKRLAKLLMLTRASKLPLHLVDRFRFDLGLPYNYVTRLLSDYPDYFQVCDVRDCLSGRNTLGLEIVSWKNDLAVSEMKNREAKGLPLRFSTNLPRGFELEKKVRCWVEHWQDLPYISPYEDAFHLGHASDQAEKWTVAVLHELVWLLVSKKTEKQNLVCLGEYLGFGERFRKALKHHPGIFYVSNKIRTQTVVLREAHRKDFLVEKHPLMGMRHRYIHLMNKVQKKRKFISAFSPSADKMERREEEQQ